jgi:hypothetical protein
MLRSRRKRYPTMVVWQFATIAALIGALLIYVMVLTNRLGTTNLVLKRIEEALVRPQPVTENASIAARQVPLTAEPARAQALEAVPAVEVASVPAPVEVAPAAQVAAELEEEEVPQRDRRVSYLTVRDLKVMSRSRRRSSDTPLGVSPLFNEVFGRKHEQTEPAESPAEIVESSEAHEEQAVPHLEVVAADEPVVASVESHEAVVEELAMATYEIRDFLETTPLPDVAVVEQEPLAFEPMTAVPAAAEPVAEIYETSEPSAPTPASPPDIVAANEDRAPAEVPAAAVTESEVVDAAALEEKRRRDLLLHAQRRRRRLR